MSQGGAAGGQGAPSNHDLNQWIEQLKRCETIQEADVKALCNRAKEILQEESNVCHVSSPVTVSKRILNFQMCVFVDEEILVSRFTAEF